MEPQLPAASDVEEPADIQERESDTPSHPPETADGTTEAVEGSSEQATGQDDGPTATEPGQEEGPTATEPGQEEGPTATEPGEEKKMVTEEKSAEDNSIDNQPAENAEGTVPAVDHEEKSDHGDLDDANGELMPAGAGVDEQDASGEVAELSKDGEITEVGEAKVEVQQESVNENETKASGDEAQ